MLCALQSHPACDLIHTVFVVHFYTYPWCWTPSFVHSVLETVLRCKKTLVGSDKGVLLKTCDFLLMITIILLHSTLYIAICQPINYEITPKIEGFSVFRYIRPEVEA